jgi:phosphatidylglycerol:prolipoprotein diacylglycerol transferase
VFFALPKGIPITEGFTLSFYSLCILTGIIVAYVYGIKVYKSIGISENDIFWGVVIGVMLGILGARLYYVAYEWDNYRDNPITAITGITRGGLAIHGGIIAAAIWAPIYCKIKKLSLLKVLEGVAIGLLIGQIFGRWGNFFNQEAHGGLVPGATLAEQRAYLEGLHLPEFIIDQMLIQGGSSTAPVTGYYHPTFLYESLLNILGLIIYMVARRFIKKLYLGDSVAFYLVWYGGVRFFIEGMRTDPLYIGDIKVARLISILFIIVGVAIFVLRRVFKFALISNYDTFYKARDIEVSNS